MAFIDSIKKILDTRQSRSILLTGNVYDLFFDGQDYVPLMDFVSSKCSVEAKQGRKSVTQVMFELNHTVRFKGADVDQFKEMWKSINDKALDDRIQEMETSQNATFALTLLRQMTITNSVKAKDSKSNLLIIIEAADMLLPDEEISKMNIIDRKRIAVTQDWLSDPKFMAGADGLIMISESRSALHHRIARLPQVLSVEVPLPDLEIRKHFIEFMCASREDIRKLFKDAAAIKSIAEKLLGLSIHAVRQLLLSGDLSAVNLIAKVENYMISQLGEGVVEFQRPDHLLDSIVASKSG
jgi:hypothetical protein